MTKTLIKNDRLVRQIIDFSGLEMGKIHPTDIDFVLELQNKALIIGEVKSRGKGLPTGQRLLLERLVDSWHTKRAIALYVEHDNKDGKVIRLPDCQVVSIYHAKEWRNPSRTITVKEAINELLKTFEVVKQ